MNWSDDDELWHALGPALTSPQRGAMAKADVASIATTIKIGRGTRVLDLGCGAGFHAIAFAAHGCDVTAVDRTTRYLREAEASAEARKVRVTFLKTDMREFVRKAEFDIVCSLYASFAYFDDEGNRLVLANVRQSLRLGGTFILDVIGTWEARGQYQLDGKAYAVERELRSGNQLVEKWTIDGKEYVARQRIYSAHELSDIIIDAGFEHVELAASLDRKTRYSKEAKRLIAFAS